MLSTLPVQWSLIRNILFLLRLHQEEEEVVMVVEVSFDVCLRPSIRPARMTSAHPFPRDIPTRSLVVTWMIPPSPSGFGFHHPIGCFWHLWWFQIDCFTVTGLWPPAVCYLLNKHSNQIGLRLTRFVNRTRIAENIRENWNAECSKSRTVFPVEQTGNRCINRQRPNPAEPNPNPKPNRRLFID